MRRWSRFGAMILGTGLFAVVLSGCGRPVALTNADYGLTRLVDPASVVQVDLTPTKPGERFGAPSAAFPDSLHRISCRLDPDGSAHAQFVTNNGNGWSVIWSNASVGSVPPDSCAVPLTPSRSCALNDPAPVCDATWSAGIYVVYNNIASGTLRAGAGSTCNGQNAASPAAFTCILTQYSTGPLRATLWGTQSLRVCAEFTVHGTGVSVGPLLCADGTGNQIHYSGTPAVWDIRVFVDPSSPPAPEVGFYLDLSGGN